MKNCSLVDASDDHQHFLPLGCRDRFYVSTNYQECARKDLLNKLVLTRYDNRTQRIDDINFQLTPATLKINAETQTTLVDYYLWVNALSLGKAMTIDERF